VISAGRLVRGELIAVDVRAALSLTGLLIRWLSFAFVVPIVLAVGYGDPVLPFVLAALVMAGTGIGLEAIGGRKAKERVREREGFLVIALVWLLTAVLGALPYLFADEPQLDRPADAVFEAMSGFTTSGASVLTDIPALDRSMLLWRQLTVWLGGMGILVLALAVLPRLRVGGRHLFEGESPGPEVEPLTTTIRDSAQRFLVVYAAITGLGIGALTAVAWTGLDPEGTFFDSVSHAMSAAATGGFSPRARSLEEFGAASQWIVTVLMVVAGMNYALMYRAIVLGRVWAALREEELRLYLAVLTFATVVLLIELWSADVYTGEAGIRHAAFQVASIATTTGFASADFAEWTLFASVLLVGLMFLGASAGSTSGSVKVVRHLLVGKILRRELDETVHPEIVAPVRLNRRVIDERSLRAVIAFVLLYFGAFAVGALILFADAARVGLELDALTAIASSATMLGNVGPAFGFAGPMGSYEPYSDVSIIVMTALMFLGRLEIIPVVVLLTRAYWRA
jgi:trk system potassium uptake protein